MSHSPNELLAKKNNLIILAVALGAILNPLNTTMITVALPDIQKEFALTSNQVSWLISSYFIVSAICLPLIGKLSDFYGRKQIFLIGLLLVAISSLTAPLSNNMLFLLGMRSIQAIGTSALYPAGIGIVRSFISKNQNRVIGTLAVFASTSAAFGPTISGILIQYGGWPIIFYVNFPVIILSAILAYKYIPNDTKVAKASFKWDSPGIFLFSLLIFFWMYFFQDFKNGLNVWALVISVMVSYLFYQHEKKSSEPFINVNFLLKNLNISLVFIQYIFTTLVFFAMLLSMPTYLQSVLMLNSKSTGITMLSISVFAMIMTPLATRWMEKSGFRVPLMFGVAVGIVGVILLFTTNHTIYWILIILSIIGISNGILNVGLQTVLYSFVSKSESGIASGLLMTSRFIGNILASSLFGVMFATGISDQNLTSMSIVLLIISVVLIPGMLLITNAKYLLKKQA
ncbi:MFS transporter [Bacillus sp. Marseille-P3661]|uniref:MFS transporter n=1 Tax=Bacillus sp. Marseille-P3661 TaxID=1936234 RepID=UPI000C833344|nr:MFS transporter [Bacillus sp. Marseille-P3661]